MVDTKTQKKGGSKARKLYVTRLDELCQSKEEVEIIVSVGNEEAREITGHISEVGKDYISITWSVERKTLVHVPKTGGKEGETTPKERIDVLELETFFKFVDIKSISKVKKKVSR